jgi:hypothetical protein
VARRRDIVISPAMQTFLDLLTMLPPPDEVV